MMSFGLGSPFSVINDNVGDDNEEEKGNIADICSVRSGLILFLILWDITQFDTQDHLLVPFTYLYLSG